MARPDKGGLYCGHTHKHKVVMKMQSELRPKPHSRSTGKFSCPRAKGTYARVRVRRPACTPRLCSLPTEGPSCYTDRRKQECIVLSRSTRRSLRSNGTLAKGRDGIDYFAYRSLQRTFSTVRAAAGAQRGSASAFVTVTAILQCVPIRQPQRLAFP